MAGAYSQIEALEKRVAELETQLDRLRTLVCDCGHAQIEHHWTWTSERAESWCARCACHVVKTLTSETVVTPIPPESPSR